MKDIIKKAIEGGYLKSPYNNKIREFSIKGVWITYFMPSSKGDFPSDSFYSYSETVLDSLFWQALGKVCGWYEEGELVYLVTSGMNNTQAMIHVEDNLGVPLRSTALGIVYSPYTRGKQGWKTIALRFHEINLTEGWEKAVEYLADLIK